MFDDNGMCERIGHVPLGVVANISAWNYPYFVGCNVIVPALLAGNAVLYKPSEFAALTGLHIARLLHAAGVPKEAMQTVVGAGDVGSALLQQRIDGLFFTGSHATGVKIASALASKLVKLQLELGGKDPTYVRADADAKAAAEGLADGAMYNTGQSCCSVERIYVHESLHDAFVERFVATVKGFKVGDPMAADTYIGAITRAPQLAVLDAQVADAKAKGAKLRTGGERLPGPGNWYAPTVFTDVDHTMQLMREESFGPIIGIQKVRSDDEAVGLMNDSRYGLTAGVYTKRRNQGARAAGSRQRRQRVLELLRPRQPATAMVGLRRLGHRPDPVDRGHPDLHAAQGLASPTTLMPRPLSLTLFDLDHTLLDGDTDVLWCDFLLQRGALERTLFEEKNTRMEREYQARHRQPAGLLRVLRVHAGRPHASPLGAAAPRVPRQRDRAENRPQLARPGRAPPQRRRTGGVDHGHQPLPHRTDRGALGAAASDRHRMRARRRRPLHRPHRGRAQHARGQGVAAARVAGKLQRLDLRDCESTFYSDSINDLPLLSAVRHPVAVNPDMRLAAVAAERGWPMLQLRDLAS